ncbi:restriction endonuclease [Streptomyces palmae]|uniref:Uncharacterized protein n=1 Tax=Streptomyces palmae TaxID=1701085 RepID=A0A4Z0HDB7_9ACTN|nr:restriction endonuclease [Streptomyces palmae]TGB18459.1 hypothetical protein E4099_01780 [Streptomyces palmae]
MVKGAALRGYLLEEALAWLMRSSGYRLLVHESQDPQELVTDGSTLRVRGRGALHQVDALGEFAFTPAFSMPVRLFLEAKFYQQPCGLDIVRNAHGVLHDVNENFVMHAGRRPRQRYQYAYALFSTSGFSADAQKYALAHQISLVDLSGASFAWLLGTIGTTAWTLEQAQFHLGASGTFPVTWVRTELRKRLGTWSAPEGLLPTTAPANGRFRDEAEPAIAGFATALQQNSGAELLLGFPAAPFILPLSVSDQSAFTSYADVHPDHSVRIRRRGSGGSAEWTMSPLAEEGAYQLAFKLPEQVEDWISDIEGKERRRILEVKEQFLSAITIYRMNGGGVRAYQLRYEASSLSHF